MYDVVNTVAGHIIFLGSAISLIAMAAQCLVSKKGVNNYLFIGAYLTVSLLLFEFYYTHYLDQVESTSYIILLIRLLKYFVGPLFYLYNQSFLRASLRNKDFLHFAPGTLIVLIFTILYVYENQRGIPGYFIKIYGFIEDISFVHILAYMVLCIINLQIVHLNKSIRQKKTAKTLRTFFAVIAGIFFISLVTGLVFSFKADVIICTIVSIALLSLSIFEKKYPDILRWMGLEIKKVQYERSLLKGIDKSRLGARLTDLMEMEQIYKDEGLSLEKLAKELYLTPHQLSEFLNNELRTNFNQYVNAYRIKEAQSMLLTRRDSSILSIAFSVGFNSKSSFNEYFKRITGMPPSEYRRQNDL